MGNKCRRDMTQKCPPGYFGSPLAGHPYPGRGGPDVLNTARVGQPSLPRAVSPSWTEGSAGPGGLELAGFVSPPGRNQWEIRRPRTDRFAAIGTPSI
jgi:hypothetical protein